MHARRCVVFTYQCMPHARRAAGYVISRWPSRAVFTKTVAALSFRPYPWLGRFVRNMIMPLKTPWLRDEYHAYDITDKFSAAFFITVRLLSYVDWLIYSWHSFDSRLHETLRHDTLVHFAANISHLSVQIEWIGTLDSRFVAIYLSDDYLSKNIWVKWVILKIISPLLSWKRGVIDELLNRAM